jgi:hypothetical protein
MSSDPIDDLIDETARGLTGGSPPPTLRPSVRARIESSEEGGVDHRGRLFWRPALAVGALAVVAFLATRPREPHVTPTTTSSSEVGSSETGRSAVVAPVEPARPLAKPVAHMSARAPRSSRVERLTTADAVTPLEDALPPIDRIAIEPVSLELAVIERIDVPMPLRIDRLLMPRLDLQ